MARYRAICRSRRCLKFAGVSLPRLAPRGQLLRAELPDRLQQQVAGAVTPGALPVGPEHHGLVDQPDQRGEHVPGVEALVRAHLLGRLDVERAGEDRQPRPEQLLGGRAQVVAPLGGGPDRLVVRQGRPAAAGQQPEAVLEPVGQLLERDGPQPHGGQLDGQRHPVQAPAEPDHAGPVGVGDGETGHRGRRALGEQLHRVAVARGPGAPGPAPAAAGSRRCARPAPPAAACWWRAR